MYGVFYIIMVAISVRTDFFSLKFFMHIEFLIFLSHEFEHLWAWELSECFIHWCCVLIIAIMYCANPWIDNTGKLLKLHLNVNVSFSRVHECNCVIFYRIINLLVLYLFRATWFQCIARNILPKSTLEKTVKSGKTSIGESALRSSAESCVTIPPLLFIFFVFKYSLSIFTQFWHIYCWNYFFNTNICGSND